MTNPILLCTVGDSHQPILRAIKDTSPAHVCFFCTDKDPETGTPGSVLKINGQGKVIRNKPADEKPTLPNIPVQADLPKDKFETEIVPADDLDGAYLQMRGTITRLTARFPNAHFIANYTGGTKTMTAALVCAVLDSDEIELQLVSGARADLSKVKDQTEHTMAASVARIKLDRVMAPCLNAWERYAYLEAAEGLKKIRIAANSPDRGRLIIAETLSEAFSLWDNFNHAGALDRIDGLTARIHSHYPNLIPTLRLLTDKNNPKNLPARLFDLWLNAERRAAQGRFDDAIARCYRLVEWTAQWQLQSKLGLDTGDFPADKLPPGVEAHGASDGKIKLGLHNTWQVLKACLGGPAQEFITRHEAALFDWILIRNLSILAHGYEPVSKENWQKVHAWMQNSFLPMLRELAKEAGLKREPEQLPVEPPDIIRSVL